jgi:hypothetical protein
MSDIIFSDWFNGFGTTGSDASNYDMCELSDGRFLAVLVDTADSNKLKAQVAKIIGDEIYYGAVETIESDETLQASCCKFSDNETLPRALICWVDRSVTDRPGKAVWVEINADDTITDKTNTNFYTPGVGDDAEVVKCCMLDENRAGIFWVQEASGHDLMAATADANGDALTTGTAEVLEANVTGYDAASLSASRVDRDLALYMFRQTDSYAGLAFFSNDKVIYDGDYKAFDTGYYPRGCALTYDKILVAGSDDTDDNYPKVKVCDMSSSWTYGADEMADGDMEAADVANWTATTATLSSESGGQTGNCMKLLENGGANPTAHWDWVASVANIYEVVFYVKAGDEASYEVEIYDVNTAAIICTIKENEATAGWVRQRFFFEAIDAVNNTRIILRQKCANGAGTYIYFDSVTIKPIINKTLTFGTAYTIESASGSTRSIHALDEAHAIVGIITDAGKVAALIINGTTVTGGDTPTDIPGATYLYQVTRLISVSGNIYKSIISYYDSTLDTIRSAIMQWQALPNIAGYCEVEGVANKLRLVLPEDADYSSLRIYKNGVVLAADMVPADPVFAPYPIRCYHPIHGVLAWRDDAADQPLMIVKDSDVDQTVAIILTLPAGKSLIINHGDGNHTDVVGPQSMTIYNVTFSDTAAYNIFVTGDLDSIMYLKITGEPISAITGLNQLTSLTELYIYANTALKTIGHITALTALEKVWLYQNDLYSIGTITALTNLTEFYAGENNLTDIGVITAITGLIKFHVRYNNLTDIGTITALTSLTEFRVTGNNLTDIGSVAALTNMIYFDTGDNNLTSIGNIVNHVQLLQFYINDNSFAKTELSDYIDQAWDNRIALGALSCAIKIEGNDETPSCDTDAVAKIEGTGAYTGDGLKDAGCTVTYDS